MTVMEKIVLENLVNESVSFSEVSRKLFNNSHCGNRQTIKNYVNKFSIDTSHFISTSIPGVNNFKKKPLVDILIENSIFDTTSLKRRLYKEGLKERVCEKCGQKTQKMYFCKICGKMATSKCDKHGENKPFRQRSIDIKLLYSNVLKNL